MNIKYRDHWLDKCKGIAIILVVFGHVFIQQYRNISPIGLFFYNIIYFFHTRLFFVLSGYAFFGYFKSNKSFISFITNKAKRLLLPYLLYSVSVFFAFNLFKMFSGFKANILISFDTGIKTLIRGLLSGDNPWCIHIWYLYVLFCLSVLGFFIAKYNKKFLRIILIIFLGLFFISYYNPFSTYILNLCCNYGVYFWVGGILVEKSNGFNKIFYKYKSLFFLLVLISALFIFVRAIFISSGINVSFINSNAVLTFIASIFTCAFIIYIAKNKSFIADGFLEYLGKNSLIIYLLHQPFIVSGLMLIVVRFYPKYIWLAIIVCPVLGILFPITCKFILNLLHKENIDE